MLRTTEPRSVAGRMLVGRASGGREIEGRPRERSLGRARGGRTSEGRAVGSDSRFVGIRIGTPVGNASPVGMETDGNDKLKEGGAREGNCRPVSIARDGRLGDGKETEGNTRDGRPRLVGIASEGRVGAAIDGSETTGNPRPVGKAVGKSCPTDGSAIAGVGSTTDGTLTGGNSADNRAPN